MRCLLLKILLVTLFQLIVFFSQAQFNIELDKRNGFQDIKLATSVDLYDGLDFHKEDTHENYKNIKIYKPKPNHYTNIGNVKINDLKVYTYRDSIFQISFITKKDSDLFKGMKKVFGLPTFHLRKQHHYWSGKKLKLYYSAYSKSKMLYVYESFLMKDKLKSDKKRQIEEITNDF